MPSSPSPRRHRGKDRRPRQKETPYRLTPARRAAGIRNLKRANLARKLEWYPRYITPEQRAVALRSLKLAHAARAVGGNYFRHGLYAALLPAAIRRAGESAAEFNAHVERFERALGGGPVAERLPEEEASLIRASAELVWRHIRAFRCQGQWERARVAKLLGRLDGYRIGNVQQAADLAFQLIEILSFGYDRFSVPLGRLRRRLERTFRDLYVKRFGRDPQFNILGSRRSRLSELTGRPAEVISSPALAARRVGLIEDNQEKLARAARQTWDLPISAGVAGARREDGAGLLELFRRIFLGTEPPSGSRLERATNRLEAAVAWRLQPFPRHAQWQAERVREIIERAAKSAPLSPPRLYVTLRRILELFAGSDRVFDHLPRYDKGVQAALQECLHAAYARRPAWDPFRILG